MNIEMKGIDKSFGSNQVLKNAGFFLKDGEIHALMGENGAGKSTLMKILTGVYTRDAGTVLVDGQEVVYKSPQEAEKAGIVFIYQEINSLFDLTVEENLFMCKEITKGFGICNKKAMRARAKKVMDKMGVNIDVGATMSDLSVGQQQMVEICKALMADAKVLIMDEPTAALTQSETEVLFEVINSLRAKGVSGMMGAGRTEIMHTIFGSMPSVGGKIFIDGLEHTIRNPREAIAAGIGFITEDRKTEGLLLEKSISENIEICNLGKTSVKGVRNTQKRMNLVKKGIEEFRICCFGPDHECHNLSGGNQQKVVLAKWIYTDPKILILDEPTRGVDIGAKKEIYSVINDLAAKGVAVIMVSSELPEVLGMSDRIMVVHEGHVTGIIDTATADQAKVMTLATGGSLV